MRNTLIAIALAAAGASAHAEFLDGNSLLAQFNGVAAQQGLGIGYVIGVADAHSGITSCLPDSVTSGQARDVVLNHLKSYPATRHKSADVLVAIALQAAWPCKEKSKAKPSSIL